MKPLTVRQIVIWTVVLTLLSAACVVGTTWWTLQPLAGVTP